MHIRAQRKFASNSLPNSPQRNAIDIPLSGTSRQLALLDSSPGGTNTNKLTDGPDNNMRKLVANRLLNTEDFLTYLCLRGEHPLKVFRHFYHVSCLVKLYVIC